MTPQKPYEVFVVQYLGSEGEAPVVMEHYIGRYESMETAIAIAVALRRAGGDFAEISVRGLAETWTEKAS